MIAPQYKIRCSVDEPIQRLMEKLSTKSPELYIFWQNYSQLYNQYSQRVIQVETIKIEYERMKSEGERLKSQNQRLRSDIDHIRRETTVVKERDNKVEIHHIPPQYPPPPQYAPPPQYPPPQQYLPPQQPVVIEKSSGPSQFEYNNLKEKVWTLERTANDLRNDCDRWRQQLESQSSLNEQLVEENRNYQVLLKQFKTENTVQKENIDHILNRLKDTEMDLQGSRTLRGNADQLNDALSKSKQTQDQLRRALSQKESELQIIMVSIDEMRMSYQRLLSEAIRNVRSKLLQSLPALIQESKTLKHLKYVGQSR